MLLHAHLHELGPRGHAELAEDLAQVIVDRARAEEQLCRDLAVGHAFGHETGDLQLLRGELVERRRVAPPGRLAGRAEFGRGALLPGRRPDLAEEVRRPAQVPQRLAGRTIRVRPR